MSLRRHVLAIAFAATLLPAVAAAGDEPAVVDTAPTAEAMTFDLFIMRPLGLVGTVLGTAIYVVALPVNLITLNLADPARRLILEPAKYTFVRDLGDID